MVAQDWQIDVISIMSVELSHDCSNPNNSISVRNVFNSDSNILVANEIPTKRCEPIADTSVPDNWTLLKIQRCHSGVYF